MKSDTLLRYEGMDILVKYLGKVNAEKFIALMIKGLLTILNGKLNYGRIKP